MASPGAGTGGENMIRMVIVDVDGTLVTQEKVLTKEAVEAAQQLRAAGVTLSLTSGRPPRGMRMLVEPLRLEGQIAGFNGGVYVNPDMSVVATHLLAPDVAREAMRLILDKGLDAWLYTPDEWLVRKKDAPHVAREAWTVKFEARITPTFPEEALSNAAKIVGVSDDQALVAECEKAAQAALGERASAARSQPYYLDVTHPKANKGEVVLTLSKLLDIPTEEIATIGDMPNDVLMFKKSGLSIAMGNASDEVKRQASVATASNEENGFAKAMREFVLKGRMS
ncbi:MAG: HAD family phosphatase [Hyphomicrobiales bacterium]|nr:HAD family phosphatase [Hyphomicrobiales bacterium]